MAAGDDKKGSLKQLATELNLSVTTVSRALGGYSDVSPATRQRVLDAAARADYVPNAAARILVTGRTDFVALIFPLRERAHIDPFLGEYITGLGEGLGRTRSRSAAGHSRFKPDRDDCPTACCRVGQG